MKLEHELVNLSGVVVGVAVGVDYNSTYVASLDSGLSMCVYGNILSIDTMRPC